ncbi:MAG: 4Fe-4S binding protein [Dehalococcoidales bacterium]|nr:4Fe-4S binding protein [Dehalococcoidales bacterium]
MRKTGEGANKPKIQIDRDKCTNCLKCIDVCYTGA